MKFMEFATIEQTLIEDRDYAMQAADEELRLNGATEKFHTLAREYHRLCREVGYPENIN